MRKRELLHLESELIFCACGCGEQIHAINWLGKPARFKTHHNKDDLERARWKGGRYINTQGYILIRKPEHPFYDGDGYVREHRLIMEQKLGRYLKPNEFVHHINGIKSDNRLDNLKLVTKIEHLKMHELKRDEFGRFIKCLE